MKLRGDKPLAEPAETREEQRSGAKTIKISNTPLHEDSDDQGGMLQVTSRGEGRKRHSRLQKHVLAILLRKLHREGLGMTGSVAQKGRWKKKIGFWQKQRT